MKLLTVIKENKEVIIKRSVIAVGAIIGLVIISKAIFTKGEDVWDEEADYEHVEDEG